MDKVFENLSKAQQQQIEAALPKDVKRGFVAYRRIAKDGTVSYTVLPTKLGAPANGVFQFHAVTTDMATEKETVAQLLYNTESEKEYRHKQELKRMQDELAAAKAEAQSAKAEVEVEKKKRTKKTTENPTDNVEN